MESEEQRQAKTEEDRAVAVPQDWEAAANVAIQVVRKLSGEGRFASGADVLEDLQCLDLLPVAPEAVPAALEAVLAVALAKYPDLVPVGGPGERRFFSSQFMTKMYAGLLLRKEEEPAHLIAETVRENSALYPRPIPIGAFEQPPFSLTRAEILDCLERMSVQDAYRDIARTRTSAGNDYLYSTTHLDPDYAASLAQWIDVGQYDNP